MTLPTFLIAGASKAGTTSLYYLLKQHPDIYLPTLKEPNYFLYHERDIVFRDADMSEIRGDKPYQTSLAEYQALFTEAKHLQKGEASTLYMYDAAAPQAIKEVLKDVKLIFMLRNPVERAYSQFMHLRRDGREPLSDFSEALEAEEERITLNIYPSFRYQAMGRYAEQLERYLEIFAREQILVLLYDDFRKDELKETQRVYEFLELDSSFVPDSSLRLNASGTPRNQSLHTFITRNNPVKRILTPLIPERLRLELATRLNQLNLEKPAPLDPSLRNELKTAFSEDISRLQNLIGRDLGSWLR